MYTEFVFKNLYYHMLLNDVRGARWMHYMISD